MREIDKSGKVTYDGERLILILINRFISLNRLRLPDLGSITFKCNRLHYNYFAIFMITLHYDYINFQM
jgi:hypothetical protein